jgi:hypothetical protein
MKFTAGFILMKFTAGFILDLIGWICVFCLPLILIMWWIALGGTW